ncbi:two-component system sensor histidine kinase YesM [Bacillus niacini]|uniref:Two-component system sensor histidine kinase YesM n=1 Tax=Neobacillus niacini TaxID=86668 RepID=A0A852TEM7_9BACI|nr:sensor histidine kinase [Neobacillus niacini]NYE06509.1 two-component system sensor histidine kinase YesM [Neobacillus niacini]
MLIMYFFAVFIPIVLTNVIFYIVTIENVKKQQMQDSTLALQQINRDFSTIIDQAVGISSSLYTNLNLNLFLEKDYVSSIDYIERHNSFLRNYNQSSPINPSINSIRFYTDNPSVIYSGGVYSIDSLQQELTNFKDALTNSNGSQILIDTPSDENFETFSIIRNLDYFYNDKQKFVKVEINPETIRDIFNNVTFKGDVYLLNEKGEIEYTNNQSLKQQLDKPINFNQVEKEHSLVTIRANLNNGSYLNDWSVVGTISEETMLNTVNKSKLFIVLLAMINFLAPTIIIVIISSSFLTRLQRIIRHVKRMKNQDFELIHDQEYQDEIGQLTSEFNRMTKKINDLINDVLLVNIQNKDLEIKRNRAQLSALQSQINPHFLFNALETIRMRSLMKDERETAKIIHNMAKIFRNSLTWGKDFVSVRDEVNLITSFLEIQKYRFGDKLNYQIYIDETAEDCKIPNMSILPFIENASIHGIEPLKENGEISVSISLYADTVTCVIKDNGAGITEEKRKQLLASLENEEDIRENVGIKNVYYRLKLYYPDQFYFNIDSHLDYGTTITIQLPSQIDSTISSNSDKNLYFIK